MDCVSITITGEQRDPRGHKEKVNQKMQGKYYCRNGKHYVRYSDQSVDKEHPVQTTLKASADEVMILRRGPINTDQRFLLQQETSAAYQTPYGVMDLLMRTNHMQVEFSEVEGLVRLQYEMAANGQQVGLYDLRIQVKPI